MVARPEWWPDNTSSPKSDGTHMVEKRNRSVPILRQFLTAPKVQNKSPWWTHDKEKAGLWDLKDAERLARLHSSTPDSDGNAVEAWAARVERGT